MCHHIYMFLHTRSVSGEDIILMFKFLLATSKKILKNNWVASLVDAPPPSHHLVRWPTTTFRHSPVNVLVWHLNRAAFTVHAVLCINYKLGLWSIEIVLVYTGWAKALLRSCIFIQRYIRRDLVCQLRFDAKMCRLVLMIGA